MLCRAQFGHKIRWYGPSQGSITWDGAAERRGPHVNANPQVRSTKPLVKPGVSVERTTRFELATLTLAR